MIAGVALTIIALCCLMSLTLFLLGEIKNRKTDVKDCLNSGKPKSKKSFLPSQIVGKTKTKLGQTEAIKDKLTGNYQSVAKEYGFAGDCKRDERLVVTHEEMDKVFYSRKEAELDVDVEHEYEESVWDEGEDELFFDDTKETQSAMAQGVSFDEMEDVSLALQSDVETLSNNGIRQVEETITIVKTTDMFEKLVSGVNNGKQKVADILDRCEALLNPQTGQGNGNEQTDGFNIEDYM